MRGIRSAILSMTLATLSFPLAAQHTAAPSTPQAYPYTFSNFIWWSDVDLRAALKQKLPALGEELVPYSTLDDKVRLALIDLLKTKGIHADVLALEVGHDTPAPIADNIAIGFRASKVVLPNAPKPSIVYQVLAPPNIQVGKINIEGAPPEMETTISQWTQYLPGRAYDANFWSANLQLTNLLQNSAYLSGTGQVIPGSYEKKEDDLYLVPLTIKIIPGPQYHVGTIKADGGPLFKGVDLSSYVTAHRGDVVVPGMCSRLIYSLTDAYHRAGYAYAAVNADPILDKDHAVASYSITVDPGPLYHFRSLTILHLDAPQQQSVRKLLDMRPGDIYNSTLTTTLQRKIQKDPTLAGLGYKFGATADEKDHLVDLTLDFYKQ